MRRMLSIHTSDSDIPVEFGDEGLDWIAPRVRELLGNSKRRALLVTDEQVALHYAPPLRDALERVGVGTFIHNFPPGERQKNLRRASTILDVLATSEFERTDVIVALGGGVVTDLAGFAASVYHRGIDWFALPTSLLGMIDAAIGGKTGVNHMLGKNLIGTIHPPLAVLAELSTLATLDQREIRSASAEFVKHGLLHGGALWKSVETNGPDLNSWPTELLHDLIPVCAEVKIKVVEADPHEEGRRMILNLGHTFGHALEAASGYTLTHGEAVFLGLRGMLRISERRGVLDTVEAMRIDEVLRSVRLTAIELDPEQIADTIRQDKKYRSGRLNWVLLRGIGEPVITQDVDDRDVFDVAVWLSEVASYGSRIPVVARPLRFAVLNGPNLNLVGEREPEVYGHRNYLEFENNLAEYSEREGFDLLIRQSNSEAELVSLIQRSRHWADGLVINGGAYTHTSIAIRDAIAAIDIPAVEVHLSDIHAREEFRTKSMIKDVCLSQISGKGIEGYREAIQLLVGKIRTGN